MVSVYNGTPTGVITDSSTDVTFTITDDVSVVLASIDLTLTDPDLTTQDAIVNGSFQEGYAGTITANGSNGYDVTLSTHPSFTDGVWQAEAYAEDGDTNSDTFNWNYVVVTDPWIVAAAPTGNSEEEDVSITFSVYGNSLCCMSSLNVSITGPDGISNQAILDGVFQYGYGGSITFNNYNGYDVVISSHPVFVIAGYEVSVSAETGLGGSVTDSWTFSVWEADSPGLPLENIDLADREILKGYKDPAYEEPEQLIQFPQEQDEEAVAEEQQVHAMAEIRQRAVDLLDKMDAVKRKIDNRCVGLEVSPKLDDETELKQAMYRVFGVATTTVTYQHYKRALELQSQLAAEDRERIKKT